MARIFSRLNKAALFGAGLMALLSSCRPISDDPTSNWPAPTPYELELPPHFPQYKDNPDNPLTKEGIQLGRMLFYDPILSGDSTQSCSSCHQQAFAFTDANKQFSVGIDGIEGNMNAMSLSNLVYSEVFFWNGRRPSLEAQALEPVTNPIEMHELWPVAVAKLQNHPDYPELFGLAFGTDVITKELVANAIAQFERTLISSDSKYDRMGLGLPGGQLTQMEADGLGLFFSESGGDCFHCHTQILMTDDKLHNNGLDSVFTPDDWGLYELTGDSSDLGKFKAPTLRNIALTAPYMHDGRFATLEEVLTHYNTGRAHVNLDPLLDKPNRVVLNQYEMDAIVAFLKTLTDSTFVNNPAFSSPFQ